ncbi:protein phosphatase 1 regulatory subunit 3C-like isoform X1 [Sinocyclocheilus rhinocerous]|uniref:Protein phosphatase 1 regulatory subunit n=2 Tax=Sinocyclocheilus rhinocerous TaxID=307959 RepID=A0A673HE23_9TELE|nr:PREDICTED: protein phosphatase 1 regulatory subunit 3C-like isoform X1 [Sinocyclocheilus rhinocerous]XP_016417882.1 PREDICTED: protein phosphatase 1 regulatory subunit 3C-like isoform X1 [Sinocyclocheilus rhinocerous]
MLKMTCANVMSRFGPPVSVRSVDMTVGFRCRGSPNINRLLGVSSPKPLRPCISHQPVIEYRHSPSTGLITAERGRGEKRVAFADAKGLSLITVRLFSEKEDTIPREPVKIPRLKKTVNITSRLRLGFEQPCGDFQAFRSRLQERTVALESCNVTRCSILGTVRVKNVCFEKAVQIRITFDAWRSYQDVACSYLEQSYGEPGTDVFEFNIGVPERINPRERIELCVSYLAAAFSAAQWDNNNGKNYCIHVCEV